MPVLLAASYQESPVQAQTSRKHFIPRNCSWINRIVEICKSMSVKPQPDAVARGHRWEFLAGRRRTTL